MNIPQTHFEKTTPPTQRSSVFKFSTVQLQHQMIRVKPRGKDGMSYLGVRVLQLNQKAERNQEWENEGEWLRENGWRMRAIEDREGEMGDEWQRQKKREGAFFFSLPSPSISNQAKLKKNIFEIR